MPYLARTCSIRSRVAAGSRPVSMVKTWTAGHVRQAMSRRTMPSSCSEVQRAILSRWNVLSAQARTSWGEAPLSPGAASATSPASSGLVVWGADPLASPTVPSIGLESTIPTRKIGLCTMPDAPGNNPRPLSVQARWAPRPGADEIPCVYLVGAGPGDPHLLTVRAATRVQAADAVFHDDLVPRAILDRVGPGAELVSVGHRAGGAQPEVIPVAEPMAARARAGDLVVRLKGGDPFLFGRGGEEAAALLDAGVAFEVVPGVSSALAAPAAAGIPVTHRGMAGSVTIITGHEAEGEPERVRWDALATASDTLVVMMGAGRLRPLSACLIAA